MNRKFNDVGNGGVTEWYKLVLIACDGSDTKYQGKICLPFEYGNIEKRLCLIARFVCCVTRTL